MRKAFLILSLVCSSLSTAVAAPVWQGSAVLVVKPARLAEFQRAVAKIVAPTRLEPGCISYAGYQVIGADGKPTNRFEFHEVWIDRETMLVQHKERSPHMREFFRAIHADQPDTFLESFSIDGKWVELVR